MFSPIAVAAKMRIEVAIDMLASEPPWVNGKRNATANAPRVMTCRCRWETPPNHAKNPDRARAKATPATNTRNRTKTVPSSWPSA